ncbi:GNAT family N-acetyltransferase [Clostridium sporogenes]|uniref:GNAT family N-acetyltransferase n=1 Tax=Clostridium sporogenes TaxID=1509 RepID=UPI0013D3FD02|nr:GNAT family protein [Clostridium sporogenes]MBU5301457.1 GNAT family N-acetyltransferase [Clostridium sporogenes]NFP92468.1 GNAT family N-acetyltransferase [Clostridium sporogenes]
MKNVILKNGKKVTIRKAKKEDAQFMIDFYNLVGGETDFLSFGKNEFKIPLKDYENLIESTNKQDNSIILLAIVENKIISIASIESTYRNKGRHVGTFGIVISKNFWGLGLGSEIMNYLIDWAKSNGITKKINLVTNENNPTAIRLYEKFGFEKEGILKKETFINGVYYDLIAMGLLI